MSFESLKHTAKLRDFAADQRGFTLIELIMVIVILGVLAVFAAPRIFNNGDFYARGFHDETLAYLRYAQKTAIAQRRTVCVAFSASAVIPSTVALSIASAAATSNCSVAGSLTGPKGENPAVLQAKSGVTFDYAPPSPLTAPSSFNFDGLGQPVSSSGVASTTLKFQVANIAKPIFVEAATGYVHD